MINSCSDIGLARILSIVVKIITLIQIIAPILLLVMTSIQLAKLVINPDEKGGIKKISNKFHAALIIFFIPMFVNIVMNMCSNSFDFAKCYNMARTINSSMKSEYVPIDDNKRTMLFDTEYEKGIKKDNTTVNGYYSKNVESFMNAVKNTVNYAKTHNYHYGDSHGTPPTSDGIISCDRLASKALWDIGYTDQRQGGEVVTSLDNYLVSHGWVKSTNINDCKYGSIVLVSHNGTNTLPHHAFVVASYNPGTGIMKTYDMGAEWRIYADQPFTVDYWHQSSIYGVYNMK